MVVTIPGLTTIICVRWWQASLVSVRLGQCVKSAWFQEVSSKTNPTLAGTTGAETLTQQNINTTSLSIIPSIYLTLDKFTGGGYHTRVNYNNLCSWGVSGSAVCSVKSASWRSRRWTVIQAVMYAGSSKWFLGCSTYGCREEERWNNNRISNYFIINYTQYILDTG